MKYKYNKKENKIYFGTIPILRIEEYIKNKYQYAKHLVNLMNHPFMNEKSRADKKGNNFENTNAEI